MFILITKRIASTLMPTVVFAASIFVTIIGCGGGKKAVKSTGEPAPQVTVAGPVVQPKSEEENALEQSNKKMAGLALENVYFDFDQHHLKPAARETLAGHAQVLKQHPEVPVVIEGHCDERGTIEYNLALGDKRAAAVKNFLIALGIESSRLSTISYGKERPADPGQNESAWAKNRRAEFVIKISASLSEAY